MPLHSEHLLGSKQSVDRQINTFWLTRSTLYLLDQHFYLLKNPTQKYARRSIHAFAKQYQVKMTRPSS